MKEIIKESLGRSHSYKKYRNIVTSLLAEGKASGSLQSDDMTHYTLLNETRMNRLEKTIEIAKETADALQNLKQDYIWLVISEGWCGDAAQIVPVLSMMAETSSKIDMKVAFRDENDELMNLFLTNGSRSIPKLIIIKKENNKVVADWGPRPKGASDLIKNYKLQHGTIDDQAKTDLQLWYLHDKGFSTQDEIVKIMNDLEQEPTQSL
ncbi:MAG TPA: thioredoxin family protein [Flavobacterium sp.]|jgi:hypothetical protein